MFRHRLQCTPEFIGKTKKLRSVMKKALIIILFFSLGTAYSQWSSNYQGNGTGDINLADAKGLANTIDVNGNPYAAGYVQCSATGCDILLIKYKPAGDTAWTRMYNGTANSTDKAFGIVTDAAGNIYVTGMSTVTNRGSELILLKYNTNGVLLWVQTYGETKQNRDDMGLAIGMDNPGNIYVTGFTTGKDSKRNLIVRRYSSAGDLMFSAIEDGEQHLNSEGFGITVDNSGNIFVTGYTNQSNGFSDIITLKYNNSGNQQWKKTFNGAGNKNDKAYGIAVDNLNNIYVTGYVTRTTDTNNTDAILIQYNKKGNQVWADTLNGNGNPSSDKAWGIVVDSDNMIYITGQIGVYSQGLNYLVRKYTSTGTRSWVAVPYNGPANGDDYSTAIALSPNQKVAVTGASMGSYSNFDYATLVINGSNGNYSGATRYGMSPLTDDIAEDVAVSSTNKVYVTGYSELETNAYQSAVSTIMLPGGEKDNNIETETALKFNLSQNYPNPFNPSTTIGFDIPRSSNVKLVIYDMLGKVVDILVNGQMDAGNYSISYTNRNLSSGIYFYELTSGDFREIRRMTLVK